jgi:hypothetical protein
VLCAGEFVAGAAYGVGNADDIYGIDGCRLLATHLRDHPAANALVGYRLADAVIGHAPVTRGICRVSDEGTLLGVDERRQVSATDKGEFVAGDGGEPATLSPDVRVSMNLWGFSPGFHETLQAAMAAAVDASEEREVLLPEVVAASLGGTTFSVLEADGKCIGVTHPADLPLVQDELNRQIATGERPAGLWAVLR